MIDDFCVLSAGEGGIEIGNFIHVAVFCSLIGKGKITIGDFANLSSSVSIYSSNDDYSGEYMTNPMVPSKFTGVSHAAVTIGRIGDRSRKILDLECDLRCELSLQIDIY